MKQGYLTIYLSLIMSLILAFILTMIEGARINTIRMEGECVADIAMNSILAEYHRELLEQYDLFFVDMSYGTDSIKIEHTAEHLRNYMEKNFNSTQKGFGFSKDWLALSTDKVLIKNPSIASDENGNVVRRQILEYMKTSSIEGILAEMMNVFSISEDMALDSRDLSAERTQIQSEIDGIELPTTIDEEGNEREIAVENPADHVDTYRNSMILNMILEDSSKLSGTVIKPEEYISGRGEIVTGSGLSPEWRKSDSIAENLLFDQYLIEKCGRYGNEMEKSLLKYQLEYIISGKSSDVENLEEIAKKLLLWREIANVTYLFSDSVKCMEAEALAYTLSAVLMVPALAEPVKYSILFAWAYIESLCDVRALLEGGKIPLIKISSDWKTGINSILDFSGRIPETDKSSSGLDYLDYLKIMLINKENNEKNMRLMDLIEMDIRQTQGNEFFCMDGCFDSYICELTISSGFGYQFDLTKRYGYH